MSSRQSSPILFMWSRCFGDEYVMQAWPTESYFSLCSQTLGQVQRCILIKGNQNWTKDFMQWPVEMYGYYSLSKAVWKQAWRSERLQLRLFLCSVPMRVNETERKIESKAIHQYTGFPVKLSECLPFQGAETNLIWIVCNLCQNLPPISYTYFWAWYHNLVIFKLAWS